MMSAALMGATAFQKALGGIHALSHPVGALCDTHHGMTNAVFMPYVLAFNRPAIEGKIARLARYLGLDASFEAFMAFVLELRRSIGVPHSLAELGVDASHVDRIAAMAPHDPTAGGNPIPLDERSARDIVLKALAGKL
jgi:alcohol dehydrogenase class IV